MTFTESTRIYFHLIHRTGENVLNIPKKNSTCIAIVEANEQNYRSN